jgi:hypothetical protein
MGNPRSALDQGSEVALGARDSEISDAILLKRK